MICMADDRKHPNENGSTARARPEAGPRSCKRQKRRLNPEMVAAMAMESAVAETAASQPSKETGLNTSTRITAQTTPPASTLLRTNSTGEGQGVRLAIDRMSITPTNKLNRTVRCDTSVEASATELPAAPIATLLRNWNTPAYTTERNKADCQAA